MSYFVDAIVLAAWGWLVFDLKCRPVWKGLLLILMVVLLVMAHAPEGPWNV